MTLDQTGEALIPLVAKDGAADSRHGLHGRTVTLKVKFSNFRQITRSRSLGPLCRVRG